MSEDLSAAPASRIDEEHESFRNALASVHADGRRKWVYARKPSGAFYRARTVLSWFLLGFLFAAPFVTFRGQPLVLIGVLERRFVAFGLVFWPQDFYLVVLVALTALVTLALVTTAFGRVWCGWLCPQTIFMEMLFRKIEYLIQGSAAEQVRRAKAAWGWDRIWRTLLTQSVFLALSFTIANVFLAYIIGARSLYAIVTDPPSRHVTGLVAITIFSLVFYGVFARFREQVCTLACPYGRVMSALIDPHTITVTYDPRRGEPRTRLQHGVHAEGAGDCVDCGQCVTVCPTAIDIRNGVQLECINCTACMDACDGVMERVSRPKGLIRLTSHEAAVSGRGPAWFTTRVAAYTIVWLILTVTVTTLIAKRPDIDVLILRQPGTLYTALAGDRVANFYTVQVTNRTARPLALEYAVVTPANATVSALGAMSTVGPNDLVEGRLLLNVPTSSLGGPTTPVRFEVRSAGRVLATVESSFLGPAPGAAGGKAGSK